MFITQDIKKLTGEVKDRLEAILVSTQRAFDLVKYDGPYFIAGGSLFSATMDKEDYDNVDVFFYSKIDYDDALEKITTYVDSALNLSGEGSDTGDISPHINLCTFKTPTSFVVSGLFSDDVSLELRSTHFGFPGEIMRKFDIVNAMIALTSSDELITSTKLDRNLRVNLNEIISTTIDGYFKYTERKGAIDPGMNALHGILDWIIEHPFTKVRDAYGRNGDVIDAIDMIADAGFGSTLRTREIDRHIHDSVVKYHTGGDRVELFQRLVSGNKYFVKDPCLEMSVALLVYMLEFKSVMKLGIQHMHEHGTYDRIMQEYPEYFL